MFRPRRTGASRAATLKSDSGGELKVLEHAGTRERRSTGGRENRSRGRGTGARQLWVEEPASKRRMPDAVRTAAVRAVLIVSLTIIQAMVAFLSTLTGSWLAFPMVLSSVASTVVATWSVLDVWVTRQVWNQRNGVVSVPSSSARQIRRERRRSRRAERAAERDGTGGAIGGRQNTGDFSRA